MLFTNTISDTSYTREKFCSFYGFLINRNSNTDEAKLQKFSLYLVNCETFLVQFLLFTVFYPTIQAAKLVKFSLFCNNFFAKVKPHHNFELGHLLHIRLSGLGPIKDIVYGHAKEH